MPLPLDRYETAEWGRTRAGIDYHVTIDEHSYSVPNQHRGMEFEYKLTSTTLELFMHSKHVTTHTRSFVRGGQTTLDSHRTQAHNAVAGWTPATSLEWAKTVGPGTEAVVSMQLPKLSNHYFGYRGLAAMKRLHHDFGALRLEQACLYAAKHRVMNTEDLRRILAGNLDQLLARDAASQNASPKPVLPANHENVRGASHYLKILNGEEDNEP
ncbi:Mu transposase domain-containing protein [Duganella qianjiadongensis]|uniref:Mu transposase domain-containing protein n=1 Tax=Duganella qianjiadongensis TaxID=2692176 RepID=UPI0035306B1C